MIRQAISCDICATEKRQTNHWFVAFEQGGELRISGWSARSRLRPGMKHLCGQTCIHKLVDEFMARCIAVRIPHEAAEEQPIPPQSATEASLFSNAATPTPAFNPIPREETAPDQPFAHEYSGSPADSSARLIPAPLLRQTTPVRPAPELVPMPARPPVTPPVQPLPEEPSRYISRNWRAEAWDRERERELRAVERRPEAPPRRRAGS